MFLSQMSSTILTSTPLTPSLRARGSPKTVRHPSACRDFPKEVAEEIDWAAFNRERGILIDKAVAGTITASEQKRLQEMQDFTDIYVERTAPRTYPDPQAKSK
jgi:hypothetical protein